MTDEIAGIEIIEGHTEEPWTTEITDKGEEWLLAGDAEPGDMHSYFIGDLENTCGECHANGRLMKQAPQMQEVILNLDANVRARNETIRILEQALYDAIRSPRGVIPDSAAPFKELIQEER